MKKRIIITVISGTFVLFLWNAISWMVLPFHSQTLKNIPENAIQPERMQALMPESGVYHFPGLPKGNSSEAISDIKAALAKGPRITLMVYKSGPSKFFDPNTFLYSLLINLLTTVLTLMVISKMGVKDFKSVITTALLVGLTTVLVSDISQMNWHLFPLDYTLVNTLDKIVAFLLLGLLFAFYTFRKQEIDQ